MIRTVSIPKGVSRMGCAPGGDCCDDCRGHKPGLPFGAYDRNRLEGMLRGIRRGVYPAPGSRMGDSSNPYSLSPSALSFIQHAGITAAQFATGAYEGAYKASLPVYDVNPVSDPSGTLVKPGTGFMPTTTNDSFTPNAPAHSAISPTAVITAPVSDSPALGPAGTTTYYYPPATPAAGGFSLSIIPMWAWLGGAAVGAFFLFGGGKSR